MIVVRRARSRRYERTAEEVRLGISRRGLQRRIELRFYHRE